MITYNDIYYTSLYGYPSSEYDYYSINGKVNFKNARDLIDVMPVDYLYKNIKHIPKNISLENIKKIFEQNNQVDENIIIKILQCLEIQDFPENIKISKEIFNKYIKIQNKLSR
jgi:hypothetical protein